MTATTEMRRREAEPIEDASALKPAPAAPAPAATHQQHSIKLYLVVWGLLFVLSACSYSVDYFNIKGVERWFLIVLFMLWKAALIVGVFMHMAFERLALVCAILAPPLALMVLAATMAMEGDYTFVTRLIYFGAGG